MTHTVMGEEAHRGTGLTWWPAAKVPSSLDSVGTNRYCRDSEHHTQRWRPDHFTGGAPWHL